MKADVCSHAGLKPHIISFLYYSIKKDIKLVKNQPTKTLLLTTQGRLAAPLEKVLFVKRNHSWQLIVWVVLHTCEMC